MTNPFKDQTGAYTRAGNLCFDFIQSRLEDAYGIAKSAYDCDELDLLKLMRDACIDLIEAKEANVRDYRHTEERITRLAAEYWEKQPKVVLCAVNGCDNKAVRTWSGHPTCASC